jgi:hypothetical protein
MKACRGFEDIQLCFHQKGNKKNRGTEIEKKVCFIRLAWQEQETINREKSF